MSPATNHRWTTRVSFRFWMARICTNMAPLEFRTGRKEQMQGSRVIFIALAVTAMLAGQAAAQTPEQFYKGA